jgi:hypothetical protein
MFGYLWYCQDTTLCWHSNCVGVVQTATLFVAKPMYVLPPPIFYVDSKHVCNYIFRLQSNTKDCFVERMVWQKTSCSGFFTFIYVNYCNPSFLLSVLWMYIPSLNLGFAGLESKLASTAQEVHYTSTASCLAEAQGCMLVGIQGF